MDIAKRVEAALQMAGYIHKHSGPVFVSLCHFAGMYRINLPADIATDVVTQRNSHVLVTYNQNSRTFLHPARQLKPPATLLLEYKATAPWSSWGGGVCVCEGVTIYVESLGDQPDRTLVCMYIFLRRSLNTLLNILQTIKLCLAYLFYNFLICNKLFSKVVFELSGQCSIHFKVLYF